MHNLVHAWGYDRLAKNQQRKFSDAALSTSNGCGNGPDDQLRLIPHVIANVIANFMKLSGASGATHEAAASTLDKPLGAGTFITDIGRLPEGCAIKKYM
jgi:hypothetical protein